MHHGVNNSSKGVITPYIACVGWQYGPSVALRMAPTGAPGICAADRMCRLLAGR